MVKVFVEGGAPGDLKRECRRAFAKFLSNAKVDHGKYRLIASGSRQEAFQNFKQEVSLGHAALLLVDSECEIAEAHETHVDPSTWSSWSHLLARTGDGWSRPDGSEHSQCHLMVQTMESWLVCDSLALSKFFGQYFNASQLPMHSNIEAVSKHDVNASLAAASSQARPKGQYSKGKHSFELLALIEPDKVETRSRWAKRFLDHMRSL